MPLRQLCRKSESWGRGRNLSQRDLRFGVLLRSHGSSSGSVPTAQHTPTPTSKSPHTPSKTPHIHHLFPPSPSWENNLHSSEAVLGSSQINRHSHQPFHNYSPSEVESRILGRKHLFQINKSQARGTRAEKGTGKADPRGFWCSQEVLTPT